MPRPKSHSKDQLVERAMLHFWHYGYEATSMDELVQAMRTSRHGLYGEFSSKHELFAACLDAYSANVVTPAFARVEEPGATFKTIESYFEFQISKAEASGWPPPGCLMANTMTELAPHSVSAFEKVAQHNARLLSGFCNALGNARTETTGTRSAKKCNDLAAVMVTFTNGFWSTSRTTPNASESRRVVKDFLQLMERSLPT